MLSEAVFAAHEPDRTKIPVTGLRGSNLSVCHYAMYLSCHKLVMKDTDGGNHLTMEDGHWQEKKVLEDHLLPLYRVRYYGKHQMEVHIGKANILGHPDGLITVENEDMLEIKGMNNKRFKKFKSSGLEKFPGITAQVHSYMASKELRDKVNGCWVYAVNKENSHPYDIFVEKDLTFADPLIEAADEILLGGYEPKPELTDYCANCNYMNYCWPSFVIDLSEIRTVYEPELVKKFVEGKVLKDRGKILYDDAKEALIELVLEDPDQGYAVAFGEEHQVNFTRSKSATPYIDEQLFVLHYGAENLNKVSKYKYITRITPRSKEI